MLTPLRLTAGVWRGDGEGAKGREHRASVDADHCYLKKALRSLS